MSELSTIVSIVGVVAVILIAGVLIVKRYKVGQPDQAFIVTGRKGKGEEKAINQKVIVGGSVFVLPIVQKLHVLDLSSRRITVSIRGAVSKDGIRLNLDGIAVVKVDGEPAAIRAAAQRFLSQQGEIKEFTTETLAGALRAIVGTMTVEDIIKDRAAFASQVAETSESTLTNQGLQLDTFQIQDISDDGSYLEDLGRPEAAEKRRVAEVAEAVSKQESEKARIDAEEKIAEANRDLALKQATIKAETDKAAALAAAAGPMETADREVEIIAKQENVATRRAQLKDRELDTEIRKPADARRYATETDAAAARKAAEENADAAKYTAIAEAEADKETALNTAEGIEATGRANAVAVLEVGKAEATAMDSKAEAFAKYNDAAKLQLVLDTIPEVAKEVASPMGNIDNVTVVSTEGAGSMAKQVTNVTAESFNLLKAISGIDLGEVLGGTPMPAAAPKNPAADKSNVVKLNPEDTN